MSDTDTRALWLAVIAQAIQDASSPNRSKQAERDKRDARDWLLKPNADFAMACSLAGAEVEYVRAEAKRRIEAADKQPMPQPTKQRAKIRQSLPKTVTINDETKLLTEWIKEAPVDRVTVYNRLRRGWSFEDAIFRPPHQRTASPGVGNNASNDRPDRTFPATQDTF